MAALAAHRNLKGFPSTRGASLEIEKFKVLGGGDHIYGDPEPVVTLPEIKVVIDTFPVICTSLPSPGTWSKIIQKIAKIWYSEIAWYKFTRTITRDDIRNYPDIRNVFLQIFQPSNKAYSKAVKKAIEDIIEVMYLENGLIGRLFEIRQMWKDINSVVENRLQDGPQRNNYIPGTRHPMPVRGSKAQSNSQSTNHLSQSSDLFATQPFATQFPPPHLASKAAAAGLELERRIAKFNFDISDSSEIENFCDIIRSLLKKARDGHIQESDNVKKAKPDAEEFTQAPATPGEISKIRVGAYTKRIPTVSSACKDSSKNAISRARVGALKRIHGIDSC
ncbi:hypothetical protein ABW20_dc0104900 [Dactylellina cionopaga]|nr:hypothetical protein ABW20_dc0104900 [Dactylellina cionopaga]